MLAVKELAPLAHQVTVSGHLTADDARRFVTFVQGLESGPKTNVLFDFGEIEGFDAAALWEEASHLGTLLKALGKLERIAVVADQQWLRSAARLESALLPGVTYEVFSRENEDQARNWVLGKSDRPHGDALRMLDLGDPKIMAFELDGRIDRENAERAIAKIQAMMDANGATLMLARIKNWHGFDLATLGSANIMRAKADMAKRLDRYAIVGGPDWLENLAEMVGSLMTTDIKAFDLDDEDEAVAWLQSH